MIATSADVSRDVSPNDEMYVAGRESHYFQAGQSAFDCINCSLQAAQVPAENIHRILDLPCGHGRVMRHLKAAFPDAEITACDLLRDGVDYCAATFGAIPVYSDENPQKIQLDSDAFDLIWVGSLLTHLDAHRWTQFLELFRRTLRPGGTLVFSAHGRRAYDLTRRGVTPIQPYWQQTATLYAYERTGFGYCNYPNSKSYGNSFSTPAWVSKQLEKLSQMRIVHFSEAAWDDNQDVYAALRDPDWQVTHPNIPTLTRLRQSLRLKHRYRSLRAQILYKH